MAQYDELIERLNSAAFVAMPLLPAEASHALLSSAAYAITDLQAQVAQERAKVVEWLRADAQRCDCEARESSECACGAWDAEPGERSFKAVYVEDLADAIERGDYVS